MYVAPELSVEGTKEDPSMDMFSFGTMLLEILDPDGLGRDLGDANYMAVCEQIPPAEHKSQIEAIQTQLRDKNSPLCKQIIEKYGDKAAEVLELIARLIDYDPKKRPTSTEAEPVLQRFEQLLPPIPA
jgi:serine/threonine protein kinase